MDAVGDSTRELRARTEGGCYTCVGSYYTVAIQELHARTERRQQVHGGLASARFSAVLSMSREPSGCWRSTELAPDLTKTGAALEQQQLYARELSE